MQWRKKRQDEGKEEENITYHDNTERNKWKINSHHKDLSPSGLY
jgi:hypothetical protein